MADLQQITWTDVDGVAVIRFRNHKILDDLLIQRLGEELLSVLEKEQRHQMLVNFAGVEFLSSAAINHLIILNKRVASKRGKLVLTNIHENIYGVFSITGLDKLFNLQPTQEKGLEQFRG